MTNCHRLDKAQSHLLRVPSISCPFVFTVAESPCSGDELFSVLSKNRVVRTGQLDVLVIA